MKLLVLDFLQRFFVLAVMLCLFFVIFVIGVAAVVRSVVFHKRVYSASGAAS